MATQEVKIVKILILGHGDHGKGTVAGIIEDLYGLRSCSSSWEACKEAYFPVLAQIYGYETPQECYDDRRNHRVECAECITEYNTPDPTRLARKILSKYDGYDGMRKNREYQPSKSLFDVVIWVDAFGRGETSDPSMDIEYDESEMILIDNNGSECDLENEIVSKLDGILSRKSMKI